MSKESPKLKLFEQKTGRYSKLCGTVDINVFLLRHLAIQNHHYTYDAFFRTAVSLPLFGTHFQYDSSAQPSNPEP